MNNRVEEIREKLVEKFNKGGNVVLSTSANNIVTSRQVSVIYFDGALYFTSVDRPGAKKSEQIKENSNVALCMNTLQMTGTATIVGFAKDKENEEIIKVYKEVLPQAYDMFVEKNQCNLIKIEVSTYKDWKIVDGKMEVTNIQL